MTRTKQLTDELEKELAEFVEVSSKWDLEKVDDAKLVFSRVNFYLGQAVVKILTRLDEIEAKIDKLNEKEK